VVAAHADDVVTLSPGDEVFALTPFDRDAAGAVARCARHRDGLARRVGGRARTRSARGRRWPAGRRRSGRPGRPRLRHRGRRRPLARYRTARSGRTARLDRRGAGGRGDYFVVEPDRDQLIELGRLIDATRLRVAIDSTFGLSQGRAAFERSLAGASAARSSSTSARTARPTLSEGSCRDDARRPPDRPDDPRHRPRRR
jgi:Zinc-binding dehydrogenase